MRRKKTSFVAAVFPLAIVFCASLTIVGGIVMLMAAREGLGPAELVAELSGGRQSVRPALAQSTPIAPPPTSTPYPSPTLIPTAVVTPEEIVAVPTQTPTLQPTELPVISNLPPTPTITSTPSPTFAPRPQIEPAIESPIRPGSALPEQQATRLVIPAMELDAPVIISPIENQTWRVDHLGTDFVGHLEGTASPGASSNVVLAGHVTVAHNVYGPFAGLGELQPGDPIIVYVDDQPFTYVVDYRNLVERTDVEVAFPTDTGRVTLITCSNWSDELGAYQQRMIVVGHLAGEGS